MKKSLKSQWREKTPGELFKELEKAKKEAVDLELQKKISKLSNLHQARQKRKEIATLLTIIEEKKFAQKLEEEKNHKPRTVLVQGKLAKKKKGVKNG